MGGILKTPKPPKVEPPPPMPDPDDAQINQSAKKRTAAQMQRSGRMSTMLSSDTIAGSSQKLGG
jgi:hypothetical protein